VGAEKLMLEVRQVGKTYGQGKVLVKALDDVSFRLGPGEFVAITGPSGSGKSTLLNLIGGSDHLSFGDILIDGQSLKDMSDARRTKMRRQKIGFIFQFFNLLSTMTAHENVALPLLLDGVMRKGAYERAEDILTQVGLGDRLHHRPDEMSGGQQQRVAVARALAFDPALILADEPTGNLDSKSGQQVMEMISELSKTYRKGIVLVTHDPKSWKYADRIIRIVDGKIVEQQAMDDDS